MTTDSDHWLLLHGTPLSPEIWYPTAAELETHLPVLVPDLTPDPQTTDAQSSVVSRVLESVRDTRGGLHIVGHSFGGQVAIDVALSLGDRVRSLTVLCSRDTPYPPFAEAADALRAGAAPDVEGALARWFTPLELAAGGPVVDAVRVSLAATDPLSWAASLSSIAGFDRSDVVGQLRLPVTFVAAEFDTVSTGAVMRSLAGRIPGSRFVMLEGAAHLSPFLDPVALAALLRSAA